MDDQNVTTLYKVVLAANLSSWIGWLSPTNHQECCLSCLSVLRLRPLMHGLWLPASSLILITTNSQNISWKRLSKIVTKESLLSQCKHQCQVLQSLQLLLFWSPYPQLYHEQLQLFELLTEYEKTSIKFWCSADPYSCACLKSYVSKGKLTQRSNFIGCSAFLNICISKSTIISTNTAQKSFFFFNCKYIYI